MVGGDKGEYRIAPCPALQYFDSPQLIAQASCCEEMKQGQTFPWKRIQNSTWIQVISVEQGSGSQQSVAFACCMHLLKGGIFEPLCCQICCMVVRLGLPCVSSDLPEVCWRHAALCKTIKT